MGPRLCFRWFCLMVLAVPVRAGVAPAIEVVSPAPVSPVGLDLYLRVRLRTGDEPFTEAGGNRWCQAAIKNRFGRTVAQAILRDNGHDYDSKPADGEWTAPVALRLPAGNYSMQVTVKAGTERVSWHGEFVLTQPTATALRPDSKSDSVLAIMEQLGQLKAEIHTLGSSRTFPAAAWIAMLAVSIAGMALWLTLYRRRANEPPQLQEDLKPVPAANWKPLFSGFESIQSAVAGMKRDLSSTYQMQRRIMDERIRLARELVSLSRSLASADALDADLTQALKANLDEVLLNAGIARWDPEIGGPAPPESEQRPAKASGNGPPLSVVGVLSPGFRLRDGDSWIVLVRPVVEVIPVKSGGDNP